MDHYQRRGYAYVLEAEQLTNENAEELAILSHSSVVEEIDPITGEKSFGLNVQTPEGKKRLSKGMYLIKYGEFMLVSPPGVFESMYEKTI